MGLMSSGNCKKIEVFECVKNKELVVSHCGLAIYMKKYLKAKRRINGNSNISPCKNVIFKKML
jgi:hypothetical protein